MFSRMGISELEYAATWKNYKQSSRRDFSIEKSTCSGWDQQRPVYMNSYENNKVTSKLTYTKYSRKQTSNMKNGKVSADHHNKTDNSSVSNLHNSDSNDEDTKLLVLNVHFKVTDSDFLELFGEFKSLKFSRVNRDCSGRSLGSAELVFSRKVDAMKAIELYNGAKLDGRPLNIQVATPEVLAMSQFKNAVKFVPNFVKSKNWNKKLKFLPYGSPKSSYNQKVRRTTVEELDAQLDQIVKDRQQLY